MKHEAIGHPKMHDLATHLDLPLFAAHGIMEMLWHHAGDYSPDGDIGKLTDAAIARAVDWRDEPSTLVDALVLAKFLDRNERYRLLIHDWPDHAQEWVKKKLKRIQKKKAHEEIDWLQVYIRPAIPSSHSVQPDVKLGAESGNNCRPAIPSSHSVQSYPHAGGFSLDKFSKGNSSSGTGVVVGEPSMNGATSLPANFELHDWYERQYARHPNKRDKVLGEQQAAEHIRLGKTTMAECERVHIAWCESEGWRWKNGAKVKQTYAEWISDEGYRYMPNGHAKTETQPETAAQVLEREARQNEADEAARIARRATKAAKETA